MRCHKCGSGTGCACNYIDENAKRIAALEADAARDLTLLAEYAARVSELEKEITDRQDTELSLTKQLVKTDDEQIAAEAKLSLYAETGTGYSQQTMDALSKERDELETKVSRYEALVLSNHSLIEAFANLNNNDDPTRRDSLLAAMQECYRDIRRALEAIEKK